ncbi:hypothetical protein D3C77_702150 [compost metagenome]
MRNSRPQVARRIDRIPGRSAQRQADADDEKADDQRVQPIRKLVGADGQNPEH